jgi:hypothetical protein
MNPSTWSQTHDEGGWTVRRLAVVEDASGICVRCGLPGADTATRGWDVAELVAAHTRCVVGLGPPTTARRGRELVSAA